MGAVELKEMMMYVERIVRPVRAVELRKLQMRRELLGHLQAALEEERAAGLEEGAAWEAAKNRLGVPKELTKELQQTVSWVGRLMAPRPIGRAFWKTEQNRRLVLGMNGMRGWQQMLFMLTVEALVFGWIGVMGRHWQGLRPLEWAVLVRFWVGMPVFCVLQGALMILSFYIVDAGARQAGRRTLVIYGAAAAGMVTAIRLTFLMLGAGPWTDLLWIWAAGVIMTAGLAWLGGFLRAGIRDLGDWMELQVA
jgi:hypothetical protein